MGESYNVECRIPFLVSRQKEKRIQKTEKSWQGVEARRGACKRLLGYFLILWLHTGVCLVGENSVRCIFMIGILFCSHYILKYFTWHCIFHYVILILQSRKKKFIKLTSPNPDINYRGSQIYFRLLLMQKLSLLFAEISTASNKNCQSSPQPAA